MDNQNQLALLRGLKSGALNKNQQLKAIRALQSNAPNEDVADLLGSLSFSTLRSGKSLKSLVDERSGRDRENFDYTTGGDGRLRALMSFGETEGDREAILKSLVGEDGYVRDKSGQLALTPAGQKIRGMDTSDKNIVIEDQGFSFRDFSDFAGILPETVGSIGGAILGGGLTFGLGSIAGAGGGAMVGQALEETIESILGVQTQDLGDVAKDVLIEGAIGAGGEVLGAAVVMAGRGTIGAGKALAGRATGATEAGEELVQKNIDIAERAMSKGSIPSLEAMGAKRLGYFEKFLENATKSSQRIDNNTNVALAEKNKILSTIKDNPVDNLVDDIEWYAPSKFASLSRGIDEANKTFLKEFDNSLNILSRAIDENIDVNTETLKGITRSAESVNNMAKQDFEAVNDILRNINIKTPVFYSGQQVNRTGGDLRLFNTQSLNEPLREYMLEMRNLADPAAIEADVFLKATQGAASFKDMANLRKAINDTLYFGGKVSTKAFYVLEGVLKQIDTMMDSKTLFDDLVDESGRSLIKVSELGTGKAGDINRQLLGDAFNLRKKAMKNYREGMKKLEKLKDFSIIKGVRDLVSINGELPRATSDKLFQKVVQANSPERLDAVLKAVDKPNQVQDMLARSYIDDALERAAYSEVDPTSFNGKTFGKRILDLGTTGPRLFGSEWTDVKRLAEGISMADVKGRISADQIMRATEAGAPTNVIESLNNVLTLVKEESDFLKSSVLKNIKDGKSVAQEDVIQLLTNKNLTPSEAQRILRFFDQNPQIRENMRGAVIMDILDNVDGKIFNNTASAAQLETVLDGYKQGTLKTVLGKDTYQALREMAEELKFLGDTTKEGSIAAGSIWAQLFKHPVATLTRLGQMRAMTKAISSRTTAKAYLAGQKAKLAAKRAGRELTEEESVPMLDALNRAMVEEGGVDAMKVGQGAGRVVKGALTVGGQAGRANVQTAPRAIRQQSRQTPTSVPVVTPPAVDFSSIPIPQGTVRKAPTRLLSPIEQLRQDAIRKANIRQRAKENPAVAATLLGGLGSAGLL